MLSDLTGALLLGGQSPGYPKDEATEAGHVGVAGQEAAVGRSHGHAQETLGVGDGQGGLACCNSGGRKELDMTEYNLYSISS